MDKWAESRTEIGKYACLRVADQWRGVLKIGQNRLMYNQRLLAYYYKRRGWERWKEAKPKRKRAPAKKKAANPDNKGKKETRFERF